MPASRSAVLLTAALLLSAHAAAKDKAAPASQWVYAGPSGKLVYRQLKTGDRIADFSYAGYGGGGVALPRFPIQKTVTPSGKDDTSAIQAAIDEVSKRPLVDGVRGAVLLEKGRFHCSATLRLTEGGIVLRGSGTGEGDTVMEMTGDPHLAISVGGRASSRWWEHPQQFRISMFHPARNLSVSRMLRAFVWAIEFRSPAP